MSSTNNQLRWGDRQVISQKSRTFVSDMKSDFFIGNSENLVKYCSVWVWQAGRQGGKLTTKQRRARTDTHKGPNWSLHRQTVSVFSPFNFNDTGNVWKRLVPFGEGQYIPQADLGQRDKETRGEVRDACRLHSAWRPTLP